MLRDFKRFLFKSFYARLGRPAKVKLINTICNEFNLGIVCKYTKDLLPFVAPNDDVIKLLLRNHSYHGQETIDWFCSSIPAHANCFDIGANVGFWTVPLAVARQEAGSSGRVFAFEPTPSTRAILQANLNLNTLREPKVVVFGCALGSAPGPAKLACFDGVYQSCGWNTLGNPEAVGSDAMRNFTTIDVPVRTLDDVWMELGRPKIGFAKIDVEGFEPMVLQGGTEFFESHSGLPDFVAFTEVNSVALASCGVSVAALHTAITDVGLMPATIAFRTDYRPIVQVLSRAKMLAIDRGDILLLPPNGNLLRQ